MNKLDSSNKGADRSQLATDLLKQIGVDEKVIQIGNCSVGAGLRTMENRTRSAARRVNSCVRQQAQGT